MNKLTKAISSAAMLLSLTGAVTASAATDTTSHGTLCNPQPADVSKIIYNQFGVVNTAASAAGVQCGAAIVTGATISQVALEVFDRNASTNVSCTLVLTDVFGNTVFSQTQATTGSGSAAKLLQFFPAVATHTLTLSCSLPAISGVDASAIATYRVFTP
jgi:hypothetical protein